MDSGYLDLVDPQLGAIPGIGFAIPSNTVVSVARRLIGHPGA
jgi:S1-C subfamily serine protease